MKRGYTILFAVLVSSILLTIGVSIVFISRKQIIITGSARESQFAFYAANAGLECVMFHDYFNGAVFATSSSQPSASVPFDCNGQTITAIGSKTGATATWEGDKYRFEFSMPVDITAGSCATVRIDKYKARATGQMKTVVESRGYNLGYQAATPDCLGRHAAKVERAIRASY